VYSFKIGGTVLRSLGELITGRLGLNAMGGPVTTIKVTSQIASAGVLPLLNIAAFIGVNLAVFNLLPVPALDGCKVIFCLIEWIRKKPVNRNVEAMIHFIGIIFLFGFAILVDILQLF
jgi:regulator of sigma E protease